jgi:hypothetical protein
MPTLPKNFLRGSASGPSPILQRRQTYEETYFWLIEVARLTNLENSAEQNQALTASTWANYELASPTFSNWYSKQHDA